jgi:hypothetical protein
MAFPSVTNTFVNATASDATQVNQNFTDLINGLTDGTKSLNIAGITVSGTVTYSGLTASLPVFTNASKQLASNTMTGTGSVAMSASPTFTGTIAGADATLSGNLTLSAIPTGRVPYTTTAGLVTSGTGLTYNGSAFGVTGTAAISGDFAINTNKFNVTASNGNTTIAGTLNTTGVTTLTGGFTSNATSAVIGPSAGSKFGVGQSTPASLNSRSSVFELSAANDGSVQLPGIVLRANGTAYSTNPAWEMFLSNPSGTTTGFNISSGTNQWLTINSTGVVSIPGTLGVTGVTTATGGVTFGNSSPTNLNAYKEGTFTFTATGMTTSPTGTASYTQVGKIVTLIIPDISGTSNSTGFTFTGLPSSIQPVSTQALKLSFALDNSVLVGTSYAVVTASGTVTFNMSTTTAAWTAAGSKGFNNVQTVTYSLQ